jgi:hypothetical protein
MKDGNSKNEALVDEGTEDLMTKLRGMSLEEKDEVIDALIS